MKRINKYEQQAWEYLLDFLCFAYYVKHDSLVKDIIFDRLEKLYCKMFKEHTAPMRMIELGWLYSKGVQVVYNWFKKENLNDK